MHADAMSTAVHEFEGDRLLMSYVVTTDAVSQSDLTVVTGYEALLKSHGLDSLDALFTLRDAELLDKPGLEPWRQRLRVVLDDNGRRRTFYLKRFGQPPRSALRDVRRSGSGANSVAGAEWTWMHRLARDGIACVTPVAFGEEFRGGREYRSAILSAEVPGVSLETWARQCESSHASAVRGLVEPVAQLVARLHARGYVHRDLYLSHVFYDASATPSDGFHLIDLQRVKRPSCCRMRWIVKDLASLNYSTPTNVATRTDRLRWLRIYLEATDSFDDRAAGRSVTKVARRLIYRIDRKTRRIARHDRRRSDRQGAA